MAQTQNGKTTSVSTSRDKKKVKKALARAEKSVKAARKAVAHSSAKLRKEAKALSKQTQKLAAKHEKAAGKFAAATENARFQATPAQKSSPAAPLGAALPRLSAPTLAELRQEAKKHKIVGYTRLNKADLMAKLESARP